MEGMSLREVAANLAPFQPHVEASPRGFSSLPAPGEQELVSEAGAVPASGATPSEYPPRLAKGWSSKPPHIADDATECWEWQRSKDGNGYGSVLVDGVRTQAHRVYYEHFVGPIPEGMTIDHLCLNKGCVNPAHLEPVTREENARRAWTARKENGYVSPTHCPRGHEFTEDNLVKAKLPYRECRICKNQANREYRQRNKASLQREANQARCHDAIHTYLVELCGYDQTAVMPTFLKAVSAVEALADSLAQRQATEGKGTE